MRCRDKNNWRRERRNCSRLGTAAHPSLSLGAALRASRFAPQSCRTHAPFIFEGSNLHAHHRCGSHFVEQSRWRMGERDCSRLGTTAHPSLSLGAALRASNFAPQSCRTHACFIFEGSNPGGAPRADSDVLGRVLAVNSGGERGSNRDSQPADSQTRKSEGLSHM